MTVPLKLEDGGAPPDATKRAFKRTDLGNAERFVARHGANVRYLPAWKKWLIWDGKRWALDETIEIRRMAKETIRGIWKDEIAEATGDHKKDLVKHAMQSESNSALNSMLQCAMAEASIAITPAMLDADPWLLAVDNGVIDLRTGELKAHDRRYLMTKVSPATFDPDATCPQWLGFLARIMNNSEPLIAYLQRAVGYSLTGTTGERALFFQYGSGANGKSTFLEILRALLADYAQQADFTTFLERKGDTGPRNDIARLFGARVVTSSEVGEGKRLNESLAKTLTGNDTVTARFLHAEFFEFKPQFKLWLAANHRPIIRGTDPAIWDRIRLIPFTVSIPEAERDQDLKTKLLAELPGILAWAVQGCLDWLEGGLRTPNEVQAATADYRRDSDTLGAFIDDACELDPDSETPATELYQAYKRWADDHGEYQITQTAFGRQLEERGITAEKTGRGNDRKKVRKGIRIVVPLFPTTRRGDAPHPAHREDADDQGAFSV